MSKLPSVDLIDMKALTLATRFAGQMVNPLFYEYLEHAGWSEGMLIVIMDGGESDLEKRHRLSRAEGGPPLLLAERNAGAEFGFQVTLIRELSDVR